MKWLVYPQGEHKERLMQNVGLEYYTLLAKPEVERHPLYPAEDIYTFHFSDIEETVVKASMVKKTAESRHISEDDAYAELMMSWQGVPVSHVKIVEVE